MIRQCAHSDINILMKIWLDTNIHAHNFIPPDYWRNSFNMVKEMLPNAEIYVFENERENQIDGFIGLNDNYIEGLFVKEETQSNGIGKQLLDYVKRIHSELSLSVYQKNERALKFYLREEFRIQSENVDENTKEKEFIMVWK